MNVDKIVEKYLTEYKKYSFQDTIDEKNEFLYMNYVIRRSENKLKIGKWTGSEDSMMGTWCWEEKGTSNIVYITPYFEDDDGVSIQEMLWDEAKDDYDYKEIYVVPFKITWDEKKDFDNYMKVSQKAISKFGK